MNKPFFVRSRSLNFGQVLIALFIGSTLLGGCQSDAATNSTNPSALDWTPPSQSEWTPLFEGESLDAWTFRSDVAKEVWQVKDGVIDCSPRVLPRGEDKHLWTKATLRAG